MSTIYQATRRRKRRTTNMSKKDRQRRRVALLERDGPNCRWCDAPFTEADPATFDHLVGRVQGGSDALDNLVLAHGWCNNVRSNPPLGRRRVKEDA